MVYNRLYNLVVAPLEVNVIFTSTATSYILWESVTIKHSHRFSHLSWPHSMCLHKQWIKWRSIWTFVTFFFRLISERGLPALRTLFDNVHFKGKGHEVRADSRQINKAKHSQWLWSSSYWLHFTISHTFSQHFHDFLSNQASDLRLLMQKMENWAHRLYPKLQFDDFIDKVEKLGNKKEVQVGWRCCCGIF